MTTEKLGGLDAETQPGPGKLESIQALRGLAILMVLFCHIGKYEEKIFSLQTLLPSMTFTGRAGVDIFFVISGFIMVTIAASPRYVGAGPFIFRRLARIYPLYWFYTLVYLPIFLFFPEKLTRPDSGSEISLLRSFLLVPGDAPPLIGQGWTLIYEVYFYIVFFLVLLRPEKQRFKLLFVWGIVVLSLAGLTVDAVRISPFLAVLANPLILEFLGGCGIAWLLKRGVTTSPFFAFGAGVCLFGAASLGHFSGPRVLLYLLPGCLLVYGAVAIEKRYRYRFPRWLQFVGDASYSLYLSHILTLSVVKELFLFLNLRFGVMANILFVCVATVACLVIGGLGYLWIEKPLLRSSYAAAHRLALLLRKS